MNRENEENANIIYHLKSKKVSLHMKIQKELKLFAVNFWFTGFPNLNFKQFYLHQIEKHEKSKI